MFRELDPVGRKDLKRKRSLWSLSLSLSLLSVSSCGVRRLRWSGFSQRSKKRGKTKTTTTTTRRQRGDVEGSSDWPDNKEGNVLRVHRRLSLSPECVWGNN